MNHQQLIDERIIARGGKHGGATHAVKIAQGLEIHVSQDEFEKRARELGYVNGYRWGVEYPTNGKKPDLPSDIAVSVFDEKDESWWYEDIAGHFSWKEGCTAKFKITDTRYKPADTSCLDKPDSSLDSDSDWYDYTNQKALRLPPVGAKCEYLDANGKWLDVVLVYASDYVIVLERHQNNGMVQVAFNYGDHPDIRPLDHETRKAEAERKRFMKAACDALNTKEINTDIDASFTLRLAIDALYDAGFRMPEGK